VAGRKRIWLALLICVMLCMSLCVFGWLKLNAQREAAHIEAQATRTRIDTLTTRYGEELSQLIEHYEYGRREEPPIYGRWTEPHIADLTVNVSHHYVLEYTETRCQAYAAVAINSQNIYNDYDDRPCGFCAVYVFVRADSQQSWKLGTFLPIMGSADDLARDWRTLKELGTYDGLIDVCPQWEPCPY
jgi:hypothetical protein